MEGFSAFWMSTQAFSHFAGVYNGRLLSQLVSFLGYFVCFSQQENNNNIKREAEEEEADSLFVSSATKNAIQVMSSPSLFCSLLFL